MSPGVLITSMLYRNVPYLVEKRVVYLWFSCHVQNSGAHEDHHHAEHEARQQPAVVTLAKTASHAFVQLFRVAFHLKHDQCSR